MVAVQALTALLAIASPLLVRADVVPSEPGPGSSYNAGATCRVTWEGDKTSQTTWKDMAIQLMSGDNFDMVHVTTIATDEDGTKDGRFEYPCPEVDPNSAIYFYQFSSPHTDEKTWTTRFTIASSTGKTVPPANTKQPGGDDIPWGVGKLVDPSTAVAAPAWVRNGGGGGGNTTTSANSTSTSASSTRLPSSTSSKMLVSSTSKAALVNSTGTSAASDSNSTGAALGLTAINSRVWFGAVGAFLVATLL